MQKWGGGYINLSTKEKEVYRVTKGHVGVPGGDIKRDPDMDYIGCFGSNGQHSQILPFRATFIVVTR